MSFIRIQRKLFKHWIWSEDRVFSKAEAWIDMIRLAAYEPKRVLILGSLVNVPKGGIVSSERFFSIRWKWSRTKVRHFIDLLEQDGMVSRQKDQGNSIVTLSNYESYNGVGTTKEPIKDRPDTTGEPAKNQQRTKLKNVKNGKNVKNEQTPREAPEVGGGVEIGKPLVALETAKSNAGMIAPDVVDLWWNARDGVGWVDRGGRRIVRWQSDLAAFAASHSQNRADYANRNGAGYQSPATTPTPKPKPAVPSDFIWRHLRENYSPDEIARMGFTEGATLTLADLSGPDENDVIAAYRNE